MNMRFIATKELGRLARWLRIAGFDTVYYNQESKGTLIIQALRDDRIIITRTKKKIDDLQKKTVVVTHDDVKEQLSEVIEKLKLKIEEEKMFSRCTLCNELLIEVKKEDIKEFVPERVYTHQAAFKKCSACGKIYWQGSHLVEVNAVIKEMRIADNSLTG